jgi:predicted XRE-type DNA-binding protein
MYELNNNYDVVNMTQDEISRGMGLTQEQLLTKVSNLLDDYTLKESEREKLLTIKKNIGKNINIRRKS